MTPTKPDLAAIKADLITRLRDGLAVQHLRNDGWQIDEDGVGIGVSRQARDEVLNLVAEAALAIEELSAALEPFAARAADFHGRPDLGDMRTTSVLLGDLRAALAALKKYGRVKP